MSDEKENGRESVDRKLEYVEPVLMKLEVGLFPCFNGTAATGACAIGFAVT